jgi:hypothetical protein
LRSSVKNAAARPGHGSGRTSSAARSARA